MAGFATAQRRGRLWLLGSPSDQIRVRRLHGTRPLNKQPLTNHKQPTIPWSVLPRNVRPGTTAKKRHDHIPTPRHHGSIAGHIRKIQKKIPKSSAKAYNPLIYAVRDKKPDYHSGVIGMKVRIEENCTACGLCADTCPDVFEMGTDRAEVVTGQVPAELEDAAEQTAQDCPVEAIIIE